jgi:hypothetical protein
MGLNEKVKFILLPYKHLYFLSTIFDVFYRSSVVGEEFFCSSVSSEDDCFFVDEGSEELVEII